MQSRYSLNLGKIFGIRVSVHWSFSLLIAWIVIISVNQGLSAIQILMHILFVLSLFVCVVLHELGHSLIAIRLGGEVSSISLLPIGGMAHMAKMPESPREEFLVSAAGPLVNVIIAALLWLYMLFLHPVSFDDMSFESINLANFPLMLMAANLFIVVFNLIPAFPMDGGRLFRSALSVRMGRLKATRIAKDIGQVFAILFIISGLFFNPFLVIIGFFILLGAKGEYEMIKYQDIFSNHNAAELVSDKYVVLDPETRLSEAAEKLVHISDNGFVVKQEGDFAGILTKNDLITGLNNLGKDGLVEQIMQKDVYRIPPDKALFELYQHMQKNRQHYLPVFDDDNFLGVIDLENIHEFFLIHKALK